MSNEHKYYSQTEFHMLAHHSALYPTNVSCTFCQQKKKQKKKLLKTVNKEVSLGGMGKKRMTHSLAQAGLYFFNYTGVRGV